MTRSWLVRTLIPIGLLLLSGPSVAASSVSRLTHEQESMVRFAIGRFESHGLRLPQVEFVFHDSLLPCDGHKGKYFDSRKTVEMCSRDMGTLIHELAHAWAYLNMTESNQEAFVEMRGLDSWNDHTDPWDRRGTEHVAETLAWALGDEPTHVKWVEPAADGSQVVSHRILTLGVDVEALSENFEWLTGQEPRFRHHHEWSEEVSATDFSPEVAGRRP